MADRANLAYLRTEQFVNRRAIADIARIEQVCTAVKFPTSKQTDETKRQGAQTAISAPKHDIGEAVRARGITTDIRELVRDLDRLPAPIVARIVLNDGDPLINLRKIIQSLNVSDRRSVVERLGQLPDVIDDDFWREWMNSCFPKVTHLPDNLRSWQDAFRLAWIALANVRVLIIGANGNPLLAQTSDALVAWRSTRAALDRSITCSQFVDTALIHTDDIDLGTIELLDHPYVYIGDFDEAQPVDVRYNLGDYLADYQTEGNLDGTRFYVAGEFFDSEFSTDGNRPKITPYGFEYTGVQVETFDEVRFTATITPRQFVSDSLFDVIDPTMITEIRILKTAGLFVAMSPTLTAFDMFKDQRPSLKRQQ